MITSIHTMIYSDDAEQTRAFLRDVLGWNNVDAGGGWLIFNSGRSEMGVHPTYSLWEGREYRHEKHHEISLMCDDLNATIADLKSRGAEFEGEIETQSYGRLISMVVPGAGNWQLYQPLHPTAFDLKPNP